MTEAKTIVVYGDPVGWQRPGQGRYGNRFTPPKTRDFEDRIKAAWLTKYGTFSFPADVPLCVTTLAYFKLPKSWSNRKRQSLLGKPHLQKPDRDNIDKCILDGLQQVAFPDDKAVCSGGVNKYWDEVPRVEIAVWEVEI